MIRLVFKEINNTLISVGAAEDSQVEFKTFDVALPEIEAWYKQSGGYIHRVFVGIEVRSEDQREEIQRLTEELRTAREEHCECGHSRSAHGGHTFAAGQREPDHCAECVTGCPYFRPVTLASVKAERDALQKQLRDIESWVRSELPWMESQKQIANSYAHKQYIEGGITAFGKVLTKLGDLAKAALGLGEK